MILVLVLGLGSCQASFGEKYTRGNLEIYFSEEMKPYVEPTADYFEDHDLIQEKEHSIHLSSSALGSENPGFILKMVVNDPEKEFTAQEMSNVTSLEAELSSDVFHDPNFRIVLCNENFVEIEK